MTTSRKPVKPIDPAKEAKKYRQELVDLTSAVRSHLQQMDRLMKQPSTVQRGRAIASLLNRLEMANDRVRFFALNEDWRRLLSPAPRASDGEPSGLFRQRRYREGMG